MRLRKLGPALIAATSLLALAPAAASAHKHPSPLGRCRINIERLVPAGSAPGTRPKYPVASHVRRANAGGQPVTLYAHAAGTAGFVPVQSTTTEANGAYKFTTAAENANTTFYVRSHGAQSGRRRLRVEAQVTLDADRRKARRSKPGHPTRRRSAARSLPPPTSARA